MKLDADDSTGSRRASGPSWMLEPSDSATRVPAGGASTDAIAAAVRHAQRARIVAQERHHRDARRGGHERRKNQ